MIDRYLLPLQHALLGPVAARLAPRGISADAISLAGLALGLAAALAIALGAHGAGLILLLVNRVLDGLDGEVARLLGPTPRGAFIDIAFDFLFYASIPFAFAIHDPEQNALAAAGLLFAFMGTSSSFLAFAAIAAERGRRAEAFPRKGLYYLGGLTEGFETILAFAAMCIFPQHFPAIAWLFCALALLTTLVRWWWGWRDFGAPNQRAGPGKKDGD
jgi:phosphatidylglycerophosphate synthase